MHIRSIIIIFLIGLLFVPAAVAQKRIYETVNPNTEVINGGADLYVPQSGAFVQTAGDMLFAREDHTAVALSNGKVLIAGGRNNRYLNSAELFDPDTGEFTINYQTVYSPITGLNTTIEGNLNSARGGAAGVLLPDGTVLIAGGYNGEYLDSTEIYDPETGIFDTQNDMEVPRYRPTATLMNDGRALFTGGIGYGFLLSAEIFDPYTGTFIFTPNMSVARARHTATLLDNGNVLVVGGCSNVESNSTACDNYLNSAEIYSPTLGVFVEIEGTLSIARADHSASLLPDGRVLIAGGTDGLTPLDSAEIYDPETRTFTYMSNMGIPRKEHTASVLNDGKILLSGGYSGGYLSSAEVFDPSDDTFSPVASSMSVPRLKHAATVLPNGSVLFTGGLNTDLLVFDTNVRFASDNVSPNIVYSSNSQVGFVPYAGSGVVVAYSTTTGEVLERIDTGGGPAFITPLPDGNTLAVVSVFDNRIFLIAMDTRTLTATYTFQDAQFGFGSLLTLSPDGSLGYISSTGTGEVIQFDVATGNELQRLSGPESPAQVTVTPDGETLLVVDTQSATIHFVHTGTMSTLLSVKYQDFYPSAAFTIYNKPVLSPDGQFCLIGSQDWDDVDYSKPNALLIFQTSTGALARIIQVGTHPGFTTLTPDGEEWIILSADSIARVPVADPDYTISVKVSEGNIIGSSNIVFSQDSRYAFFAVSSRDRVLQYDLETNATVGSYQVGDIPNVSADQPSGIAISPDAQTLSVVSVISNEVGLLVDATMLKVPDFTNNASSFTGVTLINLSENTAHLTMAPVSNAGSNYFQLENGVALLSRVEPVSLPPLAPNAQISLELSELFGFNDYVENEGHLEISSDQPGVVGFAVTGRIRATYLEARLSGMNGMSLYRFPERLYDWISPSIPVEETPGSQFIFTNPNYGITDYQIHHMGMDGSLLEVGGVEAIDPSNRDTLALSDLFTGRQLGNVLITGGRHSRAENWAELYIPEERYFTGTQGSMGDDRYGHAAALMDDGNVLVSGGRDDVSVLDTADVYASAYQLFFNITGTMVQDRYRHTSTLLNDGTVLVAGGQNSVSINASAELYDPIDATFSSTAGFMNSPRDAHTAIRLLDGRVLIAGGINGFGLSSTAEIYDSTTSTFSMTDSMSMGRAFHEAVLLQDGNVLITGGYNGTYLNSAEIYDSATGTFLEIPSMNIERSNHTATVLQDGTVLIAGGENSSGILASAELYFPTSNQFVFLTNGMTTARSHFTATLLADGGVLLVSGMNSSGVIQSSELYNPASRIFSAVSDPFQTAQQDHTATLLRSPIDGYLRGYSERGLMAREYQGAVYSRIATDSINVEQYEGIYRLFSPRFSTQSPDRTQLNLINANDDSDAVITITLYDLDGNVLGTPVTLDLPMDNQINDDLTNIFNDDPAIVGKEGWIEVYSSVDRVVGNISFGKVDGNILTKFELSRMPLEEFIVPLAAENRDFKTSIAMLNVSGVSATVQMQLRDAEGVVVESNTVALGSDTSMAAFLSDYFPGMEPNLYGYIRVQSSQPLHSFIILLDQDEEFGCAIPPIPVPTPVLEP